MIDTYNEDGIFPCFRVDGGDKEDVQSLKEKARFFWGVDEFVAHAHSQANSIFKSHGIDNWEPKSSDDIKDIIASPDPLLAAACYIIMAIACLKETIKAGDAVSAAHWAFRISYLSLVIDKSPHEKPAATGRKVQAGGEKGRKSPERLENDAAANHRAWREKAAKIRKNWKGKTRLSERSVAKQVAQYHGVNENTVRSALKGSSRNPQ